MALRLKPIANPCRESFERMPGNERTRYCDKCRKDVHDLSAYSEEEARALFAAANGERVCVRFAKDARGTVRFRAAALTVAAVSIAACSPKMTPPKAATPVATGVEHADRDMGDAILDAKDVCPDEAAPNDDGCPDPDERGADGGTVR